MEDQIKNRVEKVLQILNRPIVVHPQWPEIPEMLKKEIQVQRAQMAITGSEGKASDAEVLAYLYSASLAAPLRSEYVKIYLNLFCKTMRRLGIEPPPDLCPGALNTYEKKLLDDLRKWIWDRSVKNTKKRRGSTKNARKKT